MFNFLDSRLLPKAASSCPATDYHEVTNLISCNSQLRQRGFLAYTVIRPPIYVQFELLCPVNVKFIFVSCKVGMQHSTGIEILVKNANGPETYSNLGRAHLTPDKDHGVVFCCSRTFSREKPPVPLSNGISLQFFKSNVNYKNVVGVQVVVFRTNRCVPCLGEVQIVGVPGTLCSTVTEQTLHKLICDDFDQGIAQFSNDSLQIPKEFLDDLTFELMAVPMTLPSGKTVDRDTLDKHQANEASFHRRPNDPFTGLPFTQTRKPLLNVALKSRIDMFILKHEGMLNNVSVSKRTVGGRYGCETTDQCHACGTNTTISPLYSTPCKHFVCRNCLSLNLNQICANCNTAFSHTECYRYYCSAMR